MSSAVFHAEGEDEGNRARFWRHRRATRPRSFLIVPAGFRASTSSYVDCFDTRG